MTRTRCCAAFLATLLIFVALDVGAQGVRKEPVYKDRFLGFEPLGAVAMLHDNVESIARARRILILDREKATLFDRRVTCRGIIAHHDTGNVGVMSFFGVQLVRLYRPQTMDPAVFVWRNGGWVSRVDGQTLGRMPSAREVAVDSEKEFADKHADLDKLAGLVLRDGRALIKTWHAKLPVKLQNEPPLDTAGDEHRSFWQIPPRSNEAFKEALKAQLADGAVLRVDNHLIAYQPTDSLNVHTAIPFEFPCSDVNVKAAAIRIFVPLRPEVSSWYFLEFPPVPPR